MLLAAVECVLLLALPAFDGLANGLGALRRVLPVLTLRITLCVRGGDGLRLLFDRVVEPSEKNLVIASGGPGDTGLGADREVAYVAVAIGLEILQLLFGFGDAALGRGEDLRLAALEVVDDPFDQAQSVASFHGATRHLAALADSLSATTALSAVRLAAKSTRSRRSCARNFCIRGQSVMALSIRGSLPGW